MCLWLYGMALRTSRHCSGKTSARRNSRSLGAPFQIAGQLWASSIPRSAEICPQPTLGRRLLNCRDRRQHNCLKGRWRRTAMGDALESDRRQGFRRVSPEFGQDAQKKMQWAAFAAPSDAILWTCPLSSRSPRLSCCRCFAPRVTRGLASGAEQSDVGDGQSRRVPAARLKKSSHRPASRPFVSGSDGRGRHRPHRILILCSSTSRLDTMGRPRCAGLRP